MIGITKIITTTGNPIKEIAELRLKNKNITDGMTIINGKLYNIPFKITVDKIKISYTGDYTDEQHVKMNNEDYRLLTLRSSGTLSFSKAVNAEYWMCSGGNGGDSSSGGGGGYILNGFQSFQENQICTIGSGGTANGYGSQTSLGNLQTPTHAPNNADGASGGGANGKKRYGGNGTHISTIPFNVTSFYPHSAGGGGGGWCDDKKKVYYEGGYGGSDGSNGQKSYADDFGSSGKGGEKGGGDGASNATFYGSGGGGFKYHRYSSGGQRNSDPGAGYAGIIYIRIPYNQK